MRLGPVLSILLTTSAAVAVAVAAGASADIHTGAQLRVTSGIGSTGLSASSSAKYVQFSVDGMKLATSPVSNGIARLSGPTWGYPNGTHKASATDCTDTGCTGSTTAARFVIGNPAPTITSPVAGATVLGGLTVRASSAGGALRLLVDGQPAGFADGPDYSFPSAATALPPGEHTLQVIECSADHTWCSGTASPVVTITSSALNVRASAWPTSISPNHDRSGDFTRVRFVLDRTESVVLSVVDSHGGTVETYHPRTLGPGTHDWYWAGLGPDRRSVPDGVYSLRIAVSAQVGGALVTGSAASTVRVDTRAPQLFAVSGANEVVYPVQDGYKDTFTSSMKLSEPAQVTMTIRNAQRHIVRTLVSSGTTLASITWNGRGSNDRIVPPGRYTWQLTATDRAGNSTTTAPQFVNVSMSRLVRRTAVLSARGNAFTGTQSSSSCATASTVASVYRPSGLLLRTTCSPSALGPQIAAADYTFTLPAAEQYGTIALEVSGSSKDGPSQIEASFPTRSNSSITMTGTVEVAAPSRRTYSLGSTSAAAHMSGRQVRLVLSVDDLHVDSSPHRVSSFDVHSVRLITTYYQLA